MNLTRFMGRKLDAVPLTKRWTPSRNSIKQSRMAPLDLNQIETSSTPPHTMPVDTSRSPRQLRKMALLLGVLVVPALLAGCYGCDPFPTRATEEEKREAAKVVAAVMLTNTAQIISITASQLDEESRLSPDDANKKYANKVLLLSGRVEGFKVETDAQGTTCELTLVPGVTCSFTFTLAKKVVALQRGEEAKVFGRCGPLRGSHHSLTGCHLPSDKIRSAPPG